MSSKIKYIDPNEFRDVGFLQEVNRCFLHPLGLALEIWMERDAGETRAFIADKIAGLNELGEDTWQEQIVDAVIEVLTEHRMFPARVGGVWDYRDDPEGIAFADPPDKEKCNRVAQERYRHHQARVDLFGMNTAIQPVGQGLPKD